MGKKLCRESRKSILRYKKLWNIKGRIVGVLPGDIVSLYFGACNTRYDIYLIAGIAGSLLSIVTTTILGEKISHPFSIGFFVVLLCRVLVSAGSIFINYTLNKRKEEDF